MNRNNQTTLAIEKAEELLLDGLSFPNGKRHNLDEEEERNELVIPLIIEAYKEAGQDQEQLGRVYYLARSLTTGRCHMFFGDLTEDQVSELERIAEKGRDLGDSRSIPNEERINVGRLFVVDGSTYVVQVPDPRMGCSASICSNCQEPVAFCDKECPNCLRNFIGPFGIPAFDEWDKMSLSQKQDAVTGVFHSPKGKRLNRAHFSD